MKTQASSRTTPVRGHYSLIQFCPDTTRLEAANIGIALFCSNQEFLQTRIIENNGRIIQMFGRGERDLGRLRAVKKGLCATLEGGREDLQSLEQLQRFASLQVNHLRMTPFMPCRVMVSPEAELETLYNELVATPGVTDADDDASFQSLSERLDALFDQPLVSPYIRRDVNVEVPIFQTRESIPYAYQNGRLNLIKPIEFPVQSAAVIDKAARNAIEGKSIYDNPDSEYGDMQLVIVGSFPKTKQADIETTQRIFDVNHVQLYTTEQLDSLEREIITHGHRVQA